ncbi:MAG: hypothetical protein ACI4MI_01825 [Christensenellales bacterium]
MKRSYRIAISGISAALAIVALMLAIFLPTAKLAFFVISALCVSLPLTQGLWWSGVATYAVAAVIGFLAGNIKALPFILFFGLYSLITWLLDYKFYSLRFAKVAKIIIIVIAKVGYFALAFWACYRLMGVVISDVVIGTLRFNTPIFWLAGIILFCIYDPLYRAVFNLLGRRVAKITRNGNDGRNDEEDPADLL